jgi:mxaD protein
MKVSLLLAGLMMSASFGVFAADAKVLKVEEKIEINAPAQKVWSAVNNFGDLGAWHPAVAKTEIKSGTNNRPGAVRELTLKDGGKITEKLRRYNDKKMMYEYTILDGVLPVNHYVSDLAVQPEGEAKTLVTWKGSFKRKDLSAAPAAGQDDDSAVKTITGVYRGGLDNLKKITEK